MNRKEIMKLIGICSANYSNFPQEGKEEPLIQLWMNMLSDTAYEVAALAIQKHLSLSKFPPTVAEIRSLIVYINNPERITGMEAWGNVTKAIRVYGSYRETEAKASLDPLSKSIVEMMGYRNLCMSENDMADRAHFTKAYDSHVQQDRDEELMPAIGRGLIQKLRLDKLFKMLKSS